MNMKEIQEIIKRLNLCMVVIEEEIFSKSYIKIFLVNLQNKIFKFKERRC